MAKEPKIKVHIPKPRFKEPAEHAWAFASQLRLPEIVGNPTFGETAAPWMKAWFMHIFGDTDYDHPKFKRKTNTYFLLIPKKNAKTTTAAIIMLTTLVQTPLYGIEMVLMGSTQQVVDNCVKTIKGCVENDPYLSFIKYSTQHGEFRNLKNNCRLQITAANPRGVAGKKAPYVFIDELWEIGKLSSGANIKKEATGGLASYPQGFVIYATTQSDEPPTGAFKAELQTARDVRDKKLELPSYLPILYEFPRSMIRDQTAVQIENFHLVNPSLGYSVDLDYLKDEAKRAANEGTTEWRQFTTKHLNIQADYYSIASSWSVGNHWEACKTDYDYATFLKKADILTFGVDIGGRSDFFAVTALAYNTQEDKYYTWAKAWLTRDGYFELQKKRDYKHLVDNGQLILVDLYEDAHHSSIQWMNELMEHDNFYKCGFDPMDSQRMIGAMKARSMRISRCDAIPHGYRMKSHIHRVDGLVGDFKLMHHLEDKLLTMCILNIRIKARGSDVMVDKENTSYDKIDSAVALILAMAVMKENPNEDNKI